MGDSGGAPARWRPAIRIPALMPSPLAAVHDEKRPCARPGGFNLRPPAAAACRLSQPDTTCSCISPTTEQSTTRASALPNLCPRWLNSSPAGQRILHLHLRLRRGFIHLEGVEGIGALDGSGSRESALGRERIGLCEHARGAGDADGRCQSGAGGQHSHTTFQGLLHAARGRPGRCARARSRGDRPACGQHSVSALPTIS